MKRLILLATLLVTACAPVHQPPAPLPVPVPSPLHAVGVTVRDETGAGMASAVGTLHPDSGLPASCLNEAPANPGRITCTTLATDGAHLEIEAPGYQSQELDGIHIGASLGEIHLVPARRILSPVVLRTARSFQLETGEPWAAVEASDFNLAGRLADEGASAIEPVLEQRETPDPVNHPDWHFNLLRVFTAYDICPFPGAIGPDGQPCDPAKGLIGRLIPREHPDLYTRILPQLADLASRHNERLELVAFTGPYTTVFANDDEKVAHWESLCALRASRPDVIWLEQINEWENKYNQPLPYDRLRDCGGLISHGSGTADATPMLPPFRYGTHHTGEGLSGEPQRRPGHDAMDVSTALGVPVTENEWRRFTPTEPVNCGFVEAVARSAVLLAAGMDYHTVTGKHSGLWQGDELRCAIEFLRGAYGVPWDCKDSGGYIHAQSEEGDTWVRVFRWGTRPECFVQIPK